MSTNSNNDKGAAILLGQLPSAPTSIEQSTKSHINLLGESIKSGKI
jgi:hypothetical protein